MASLKLTMSLPEELAVRFVRAVPANRRSRYLAALIGESLREKREQQLIDACGIANEDPETRTIELEMAALPDTLEDDWHGSFELPAAR